MAKLIAILLGFLSIGVSSQAQDDQVSQPTHKLGFTFSGFGKSDVVRANELDGAPGIQGDKFYTLGLNYLHSVNSNWLSVETGVEYTHYTFILTPNLPPDMDRSPYNINHSMISLPIGLRAGFLEFLFVNGGFLIDLDASTSSPIDSQTGIGLNLGAGLEYDFSPAFSMFISTHQKIHALLPFSMDKNHQKVWETGLRIGLMIGF